MNLQDPKVQEFVVGIILTIWVLSWKGFGLWRASQNKQKNWFILILVINALGFLEIAYLVFFQSKGRYWETIKQKLLTTSPISLTKK